MGPVLPPKDILLPNIIDFHLEHNADCKYAILTSPLEEDLKNVPTNITWREFGRAVHRAAYTTRTALKSEGAPSAGNVVSLLASTDVILYQATVLGIIQSGNIVNAMHSCFSIETNWLDLKAIPVISSKFARGNDQCIASSRLSSHILRKYRKCRHAIARRR